jgi:starch-binding outer membrane protein, SusD/RagB family
MKNIVKLISLSLALLVASGCEKQLLEQKPQSFISPDSFYANESEALAAVTACYDRMGNYTGMYPFRYQLMANLPTDDLVFARAAGTLVIINTFTYDPSLRELQSVWQEFYQMIQYCNYAIDRIPNTQMSNTALKNRLIGEARFIRALGYLELVRLFGDLPLVITPTTGFDGLKIPRTPAQKVYEQIIEDLKFAETNLSATYTGTNIGRATIGAAKGLMAKTYLTMASPGTQGIADKAKYWQLAADKCKEVIDLNRYTLQTTYAGIFANNNENNSEVLFDVQFSSGFGTTAAGEGTLIGSLYSPFGSNNFYARPNLFQSFDPLDKRREMVATGIRNPTTGTVTNFPASTGGSNSTYGITKWINSANVGDSDGALNYIILRYADIYLMYAEALNELNKTAEAYAFINPLRKRAGLADLATGLNQTTFRDALQKERRAEMFAECSRWFDLVRWGKLVSTMKALNDPLSQIAEKHNLFPIPQSEMDRNPALKQNTGW